MVAIARGIRLLDKGLRSGRHGFAAAICFHRCRQLGGKIWRHQIIGNWKQIVIALVIYKADARPGQCCLANAVRKQRYFFADIRADHENCVALFNFRDGRAKPREQWI